MKRHLFLTAPDEPGVAWIAFDGEDRRLLAHALQDVLANLPDPATEKRARSLLDRL